MTNSNGTLSKGTPQNVSTRSSNNKDDNIDMKYMSQTNDVPNPSKRLIKMYSLILPTINMIMLIVYPSLPQLMIYPIPAIILLHWLGSFNKVHLQRYSFLLPKIKMITLIMKPGFSKLMMYSI